MRIYTVFLGLSVPDQFMLANAECQMSFTSRSGKRLVVAIRKYYQAQWCCRISALLCRLCVSYHL